MKYMGIVFAIAAMPCFAVSLPEAMTLARQNDPVFLSAKNEINIAKERVTQARAALLPQANASANAQKNQRHYTSNGALFPVDTKEKYSSNAVQVNLNQTIWQHSKWLAMEQAQLTVQMNEMQLAAAEQELLLRLISNWLALLHAEDVLRTNQSISAAAAKQLAQIQREQQLGIVTSTVLDEAWALAAQANAEVAQADSQLATHWANLEQITGSVTHTTLPGLRDNVTLPSLEFASLEAALRQAESSNPQLNAKKIALEIANNEASKQRAGHEPVVELTASYARTEQGAGISGGQSGFDSRLGNIGVQLNVPLYSGGGQNSRIREALLLQEKARLDHENTLRNIRLSATQAWHASLASKMKFVAAQQSLKHSLSVLNSNIAERKQGLKVGLDVLQAEQKHTENLAKSRQAAYDNFLSFIKLQASTGKLTERDIQGLVQYFLLP